ncbi:MAG: putative LPS assembly protein LptD [Rhodothermales bacterium]
MTRGRRAFLAFVLFLTGVVSPSVTPSLAQETDQPGELPNPVRAPTDTVRVQPADTPEGQPPASSSAAELDEPVHFSATDSLVIQFGDEGDVGRLYGDAQVSYGGAELTAYRIDILFDIDELRARGVESDTGTVGRPAFTRDGDSFQGSELAFNLRSERGRVVGAQTSMQDGFIRADVVKVDRDSTIYVTQGSYTTCECIEDPSYSLRSRRMKIVDQEWIYTGPIQLFIFNVPTPLWLPFGFLPAQEGRRSGPLPPQYGEDDRGFYLREWGWYQAINDYMDAQIQFGLWTRGSWQINPQFRYARRYAYSGQVSLDYVQNRSGERGDPDFSEFGSGRLRWSHNQDLTPTSRLNANVDLSSSSYLRTSSEQYDDRVRQTIQSSAGYSKSWRQSGRNLSVNLSHRQNLASGTVSARLPSLSFRQNTRKPFERENRIGAERWYERISYGYSASVDNNYSFSPSDTTDISWYEAMFSPSKYRQATGASEPFEFQASHRLNTGASFTVNRLPVIDRNVRVNLSPSANYTEDWFIQTERRGLDEDSSLVVERVPEFFALRQFSTGLSANSTFYGQFPVRIGAYEGLRHTVRPTMSFNYRPDFFSDRWGYTDTYVDADGREQRYALVRGVQRSRQQSLSFNMDNIFETKRVEVDTTGQQTDRTVQLLNLGLSSGYNFAADSLGLDDLRLRARTQIANKFNLNASASLSPYALNADRTREIDRLAAADGLLRFARLTQFRLSLNTSFRSDRSGPERPFGASGGMTGGTGLPGQDPTAFQNGFGSSRFNTPTGYADFAIPWSLRLDFSYSYSKRFSESTTAATLNSTFDFNLTPDWKVQGRSGYDFSASEIVYTSVSIMKDFDCWEMAVNWVPFGPYQSYSFDIHVKSGQLRDLLRLRQPRSDVGGRFGRLLD